MKNRIYNDYNGRTVWEKHMYKEFLEIPPKKRYDLCDNIDMKKVEDMNVLRTWMVHLEDLHIPFVVTRTGNRLILWKELKAEEIRDGGN